MLAYKKLLIKSDVRDYSVFFVNHIRTTFNFDSSEKYFLVVDERVAKIYKNELRVILKTYPHLCIVAREEHKTLQYINFIIKHLIDKNVKMDHALVAIGGGIIQDITSFIASILFRGMDWIFYPTTLLAQSDSCIGSKTSINIDEYKNQVGNFYPPRQVYLNAEFLRSLSKSDIKSGLGEIVKVHFLDSERSLKYIKNNYDCALKDSNVMKDMIFRSLKIKKRVIEKDEFDTGYRKIMNYGHTFGHALESVTNFKLPHGQAVTVGMDISNYLSHKLGFISEETLLTMRKVLEKNWPAYSLENLDLRMFFSCLLRDKKNIGNKVVMILTKGPGKMFRRPVVLDGSMKRLIALYFKSNISRMKKARTAWSN